MPLALLSRHQRHCSKDARLEHSYSISPCRDGQSRWETPLFYPPALFAQLFLWGALCEAAAALATDYSRESGLAA
jgi:hypothetical protein